MKKVLITGTTGFIGSRLATLLNKKYDVYCLERYVTGRYVAGQQRKLKTVYADLNDYSAVRKIIRETKPEYVVHLASISPVSYSYLHPFEIMQSNLLSTINLAETCCHENPKFRQFLFAGTSEEYGNQKTFPIKESANLKPNSPYSLSKIAADKYLNYMKDAYDFPVTVLRPFNTYGRKKNHHFVVERIVSQALRKEEIRLGSPDSSRDFLYVDDHVNGYVSCLGNVKAIGETFNICTGVETSIEQLVGLIRKLTNHKEGVVYKTLPPRPLDIKRLVGSYKKINSFLGWKPLISLKKGLKETINMVNIYV